MVGRAMRQRQVLALLLALTALALPVSGAVIFGGVAAPGSGSGFVFLGAVSVQDFVPVLLLVGALGILVTSSAGAAGRTTVGQVAAGVTLLAGAVLAVAHLGTAYHLRAGGAFDLDAGGGSGWVAQRIVAVATMLAAGVLCGAVAIQAAMWMGERKREVLR
jgi:hypothetical protein